MLTRLTAVAIAVSFLAVGCGGTSRRTLVGRYIDSVNLVEAKLAKPLLAVSKADREFAQPHADLPSVVARLHRSRAAIHLIARRLSAVQPPPEARRLQALLVELIRHEEELTGEVMKMAVFLPAFDRSLRPIVTANATLKTALAAKSSTAAKASALDAFRLRIDAVSAALRALSPPPSSRPVWSQQIATLERVRTDVVALAAALRAKRATVIPKLVHDFDVAAASNQTVAAQRVQIAADIAYNRRIKSLNTLGAGIAREEARLQGAVK